MKFAKELQEDLVPEWRAKHVNYKLGKKKVKAISRALAKATRSPQTPKSSIFRRRDPPAAHPSYNSSPLSRPSTTERDLLQSTAGSSQQFSSYGSITRHDTPPERPLGPPSLELPGPALSPSIVANGRLSDNVEQDIVRRPTSSPGYNAGADDVQEYGDTAPVGSSPSSRPRHRRTQSFPSKTQIKKKERSLIKRLFSDRLHHVASRPGNAAELQASPYKDFEDRQDEFFEYLHSQLETVESFYASKEDESIHRLELLKDQLHKMRDLRVQEVQKARRKKSTKLDEEEDTNQLMSDLGNEVEQTSSRTARNLAKGQLSNRERRPWYAPIEHKLGIGEFRFGPNTEALERMVRDKNPQTRSQANEITTAEAVKQSNPSRLLSPAQRDYQPRSQRDEKVPYERAKRLLKAALQEYYRGLELLKTYTLLNRKAFRKINKKYDKAVQARPILQFFNEHVNCAYFVKSSVVEQCMVEVEDLFSRYFAGGNRKVAISKLRGRVKRPEDVTDSMFRSGLFLGAGLGLAIPGLLYAGAIVTDGDPQNLELQTLTSYLLQLYGGYFLMLMLFFFFCFDARLWMRQRINYVFIFEFDTRHNLDWRQLLEIPSFLFFLLGLLLLLNFHPSTRGIVGDMFIYWPVVLIGVSLMVIFVPLPVLYHKSRLWFAESNARLLLAGLFSVEFRDFFLGDMFCSLTYSLGNIEVFFCLYANGWVNPTQCNSSHSRLLGFFSALPGIWRLLQCLRRYFETKNAFPHLLNCGKYLATILSYMTLSLYRINSTNSYLITFIVFATINGIYTSLWDIFMDWSLGHPGARHRFLRNELGYKQKWWYYGAMLIDPPLRFNWIFYAIFHNTQLQHSAVLSFFIAMSEILRRGIWTIFRVENEHCTNVGRFRASRDIDLPYTMSTQNAVDTAGSQHGLQNQGSKSSHENDSGGAQQDESRSLDVEAGRSAKRPRGPESPLQRMSTAISLAHAQDFVRRRLPGDGAGVPGSPLTRAQSGDADMDSDEDEEQSDNDE